MFHDASISEPRFITKKKSEYFYFIFHYKNIYLHICLVFVKTRDFLLHIFTTINHLYNPCHQRAREVFLLLSYWFYTVFVLYIESSKIPVQQQVVFSSKKGTTPAPRVEPPRNDLAGINKTDELNFEKTAYAARKSRRETFRGKKERSFKPSFNDTANILTFFENTTM